MYTVEKNGVKITLMNEIQLAAYKNSGWTEVKENSKKKENKKTEE